MVSGEGLKTGCCCMSGCSWYELIGRGRHYREEPKLAEEPRNTQNSRQSRCRSSIYSVKTTTLCSSSHSSLLVHLIKLKFMPSRQVHAGNSTERTACLLLTECDRRNTKPLCTHSPTQSVGSAPVCGTLKLT